MRATELVREYHDSGTRVHFLRVEDCDQARIVRADGTPVVDHAGSSVEVHHVPTGRTVRRGQVRR